LLPHNANESGEEMSLLLPIPARLSGKNSIKRLEGENVAPSAPKLSAEDKINSFVSGVDRVKPRSPGEDNDTDRLSGVDRVTPNRAVAAIVLFLLLGSAKF